MRVIPTCHPNRRHHARGLCDNCYPVIRRRHRLADYPPVVRSREAFLEDYTLLRSEGHTRGQIAERLGLTRGAVDQAISRARRAGVEVPG